MDLEPPQYLKATAPMPVVLVSTCFGDINNVAPYAWHMPISMDPPLLGVAIRKIRDTFSNIEDTGEFVMNLPGKDLIPAIKETAKPFPRDESEFEKAGLTPRKSKVISTPGVEECITSIECRLEWMKEAGDHHVVVGRVVHIQISRDLSDRGIDHNHPDAVIHIGGGRNLYATIGDIIG
jgi:flavin reductase (DIM6/NTAB) family NADH-FMN oxidoreductase RutF